MDLAQFMNRPNARLISSADSPPNLDKFRSSWARADLK